MLQDDLPSRFHVIQGAGSHSRNSSRQLYCQTTFWPNMLLLNLAVDVMPQASTE
jgi:hypothetical protein